MTQEGTIVSVSSLGTSKLTDSIVSKKEYSCDCGVCMKFLTYLILDKFNVKEFCITESYLVVILDNAVKKILLESVNNDGCTTISDL